MLTVFGFTTYVFIPMSILFMNFSLFFLIIFLIHFLTVLGMIFLSSLIVPKLEQAVLYLITFLIPSDRRLRSIISKNLKSHSSRNIKTSITFIITVGFLIYCGTTFLQMEYEMLAVAKTVVGTDLALFKANENFDTLALNQAKIS